MSDGKEVKRLRAVDIMFMCGEKNGVDTDSLFVSASDHGRIVAELRAELTEAKAEVERYRFLYEDYSSEVEELQHERRQLETAIAKQAREAEVLKAVIENVKTILREVTSETWILKSVDLNRLLAKVGKALAAIEKEGEKDG